MLTIQLVVLQTTNHIEKKNVASGVSAGKHAQSRQVYAACLDKKETVVRAHQTHISRPITLPSL